MTYALNTSVGTRKVTFASTGPYSGHIHNPWYILNKPLLFDKKLMHICVLKLLLYIIQQIFTTVICQVKRIALKPILCNPVL